MGYEGSVFSVHRWTDDEQFRERMIENKCDFHTMLSWNDERQNPARQMPTLDEEQLFGKWSSAKQTLEEVILSPLGNVHNFDWHSS